MTGEQFKIFKRYLKERGLYIEFFRQARVHSHRRLGMTIKEYIDGDCTAGEEIMGLITWVSAKWKHWDVEYSKYRKFLEPILKNKEIYYEHIQKIKKINYPQELQ